MNVKSVFVSVFAFALSFSSLAIESAADWQGRDGKTHNLSAAQAGLEVKNQEFYVFSKKSYPVRTEGKYVLRGEFRLPAGCKAVAPLFFGLAYLDENGKRVDGMEGCPVKNTQTELTAPVKTCDRTMKVRDASGWVRRASVAAFNVKTDNSDLPNRDISQLITHIEKTNDGWTVSFYLPLRKSYAAGTAVRQQSGASYQYIATSRLTGDWQTFSGKNLHPWPGVSGAKIVIFSNIGKPVSLAMRNIRFEEEK